MKTYTGGCHCGAVRFEFKSESEVEIWKCNCSICSMIGYEHLFIKHADFTLLSGDKALSEYTFGTGSAKHWFCSTCGVKSFYQPRSHPEAYSINLKCVESPPQVVNLVDFDGKNSFS